MIPLQLSVKNFMCYRDDAPLLRFEGIHVACLCGDNGHGKTALLDAMTWALWGTARATVARTGAISAPRMGELVHLGQTDMSVELDFMAEGQRYRVVRRHTLGSRGSNSRTTLELQIASANGDGKFSAISRSSVRDTNALITKILNMDFKTFINTAYLSQGQADVFTTSTPSERKKCLAEVLDLSYYQRLSEGARARGNSKQTDMLRTRAEIDARIEETARKPQYECQLADAKRRIAETAPEVEAQRKRVEGLRDEVRELQTLQSEFAALRQRANSAEADSARLRPQVSADEKRIAGYEATIADAPQILSGFKALQSAQAEIGRLDIALSEKNDLDARHAALMQAIARQEERLSAARRTLRHRIATELQPRAKRLPAIREQLAGMRERHATLAQQGDAIERQRKQNDDLAARIQALTQDNERLLRQMRDTRQKFDMLEQGDTTCPLCNQQLGDDGQRHLRAEYQRVGVASKSAYSDNLAQTDALTSERKKKITALAAMEAAHAANSRSIAADEANLARDERESMQAQQDLAQASEALAETERALRDKAFAEQERKALAELESAIAALGYDAEAHQNTRQQVGALRKFDIARHALDEAQANLPGSIESLHTSRQMLAERQDDIDAAAERMAALKQDLKSLPTLTTALNGAVASGKRLEDELRQAEIDQGVLENNISRCDRLEAETRSLEREHKRLARDKSIYDELTLAFGKNGIQALVIESAIPQLQNDANELLGRISENRMHLKLELDESTSEQLEIRIADELGTRDYLTFSGGEAFRINFALRIALSRLLARRSGAPLPVLFIDEGFGSQDRGGQERLTEAIQSIQDEFEKIIVITHIEQMKEAFPARIEVTKSGGGSTFRVV